MPVTKSQLSKVLNLELENGSNFTLNCDSDAFQSQFTSFELQPGQNTVISSIEEVEKVFQFVSAALKRIAEIYQKNKEQVRLQLKLKVSWILPGNVVESSTVLSEPMWGNALFVENGVHKMMLELRHENEPLNGLECRYFPLHVQIMKVPETISLKNMTPSDRQDEGLINMSKRVRALLNFKHVGHKYPLDYVMFCSFDYEKIPYCHRKRTTNSASKWCLYSNASIAFLIDGPTDGKGIDTEGVHCLHNEDDIIERFIVKMNRFSTAIVENLNTHPNYDRKAGAKYRNEPSCCICKKQMGIDKGHIHHCHRTGRIFGRAHHNCNANYARKQNFLPVFVHCQEDDFHGILISLFHNRGLKISSPKNDKGREQDEQIMLTLKDLPLVFINAHRFLPDSLQNLKALIPQTNFKRCNNSTSYFHEKPVPRAVETTLLLADTILFLRERIHHKFELDLCRYYSLNEFVLDSILKMAAINLILPDQFKRTIRPFPGTLKPKIFELSEFNGTSPIVRALKSYLPFSNFKSLPKTEFPKFDSKFIAKLLNKASIGYIFQITVDPKTGDGYFVHYILLKYLIRDKNFKFTIEEIIQFDQTPFMDSFVSAFLTRTKFQLDRKLGQFFCKNIIENTNMIRPQRINLKSVPVVEAVNFHKLIQQENFVTAHCFAENLVEVLLSEKYKWYEFTFLSLALRDIIFTYSNKNQN